MNLARTVLLLLVLSAVSAGADAGLELRATATVEGEFVRVSDVVAEAGGWAEVLLGRTPALGGSREISSEDLRTALRRARPGGPWPALGGAPTVVVSRAAAAVVDEATGRPIREALQRWLNRDAGPAEIRGTFEVLTAEPGLPADLLLPLAVRSVDTTRTPWQVTLICIDPASDVREVVARVRARCTAMAVVARRGLTRGHVCTPADLEVRDAEIMPGQREWFVDPLALAGRRTGRVIRAGEVITAVGLAPEILVRSGDPVTISASGTGFALQLDGQAMESGAAGQVIRVRNRQTKALCAARVMAKGRVELAPHDVEGGKQ